jgi:hypothetical protein
VSAQKQILLRLVPKNLPHLHECLLYLEISILGSRRFLCGGEEANAEPAQH